MIHIAALRAIARNVAYERQVSSIGEIFEISDIPFDGSRVLEFVRFQPDSLYVPHTHRKSDAQVLILEGSGLALPTESVYRPGDHLVFPKGVPHGFRTGVDYTVMLSLNDPGILDRETGRIDVHYIPC